MCFSKQFKNDFSKIIKINKRLRILLIVILVLSLIVGGTYVSAKILIKSEISKIKTVKITKVPEEMGIDNSKFNNYQSEIKIQDSKPKKDDSITNILLLGIDSRDPKSDVGRSDCIMILTIDKKNDKLKVTSIMRDSLVSIDGHGEEKITHAHAYGGPLLSIKTVNQNYNLNIMNYVQVDFFKFEKIVDYVGGVNIDVTATEIPLANSYIDEVAKIEHKVPSHIDEAGLQTLNGSQAVGYSRIRYVGRDDFQRTERQRSVLTALYKKLYTKNLMDLPAVVDAMMPCIETSLKPDEIMSFGSYILSNGVSNIEQNRVPYDGLYKDAIINKMDVLTWDKQSTIDKLHKFIFGF